MKKILRQPFLFVLLTSLTTAAFGAPLGTAFTYQGKLAQGATPANGIYDFRFILYDADAGGSQAGPILTNAAVTVSGGLFTTLLDFGSGVFAGNARWLEIGVRTNGGGGFTTLTPRQPLNPAPHALYSPSAGTAVSATTATTAASVSGTVAATQLTGTVADARLSANVALRSGGNTFSGAQVFTAGGLRMSDQEIYFRGPADSNHGLGWYGAGRLFSGFSVDGPVLYGWSGGGLGTSNPTNRLAFGWESDGRVFTDPASINAGTLVPGLAFGGTASGEGISSKRTAGGNQYGLDFYTGWAPRMSLSQSGNVGIGTTLPQGALLDVEGDVRLNQHDLLFAAGTDNLHGVGWYGAGRQFAGVNVNGPVLYGNGGGALGARAGTTNIALQWDDARNVTIVGTLNASGAVQFGTNAFLNDKDLFLRGDRNHGVGWYGIGKPFAGVSLDGPVLYGWSGGGLGTFRGGVATNLALTWDASGKVGIGKTNPATALDVNGTITATAFSGSGAGLTGSLIWAGSGHVTTKIIPSAPANVWTKIDDMLIYTKQAGGTLEVTYDGRLRVGASSCPVGIAFELRVDDLASTEGPAMGEVLAGETSVRASITGIFTGLGAGTHHISMWVRPQDGTAANVGVGSPVGWSSLVIKEYK